MFDDIKHVFFGTLIRLYLYVLRSRNLGIGQLFYSAQLTRRGYCRPRLPADGFPSNSSHDHLPNTKQKMAGSSLLGFASSYSMNL